MRIEPDVKAIREAVKGHTPGPWFVGEGTDPCVYGPDGETWITGQVVSGAGDKPKDDGRTNAALIAAAPALLSLIAARDAEIAALKDEVARWKVTGRVFDTTAWDPMTTDPDVVEPVAVIPLAEYDRLKRLEAAVESDDLAASMYGVTGHPENCWCAACDGKRSKAIALDGYRAALRRAAKGDGT